MLARRATAMLLAPGRRLRIHPAVTQQHLRDPVPCVHQIPSARVMQTRQLTCGLDLDRRDPDQREANRPTDTEPTAPRPCDRSSPDPTVHAASFPARPHPSGPRPRPPPDRARTRSGRPHNTHAPARATTSATRPAPPHHRHETASASTRRSSHRSPRHAPNGHGHPIPTNVIVPDMAGPPQS